MDPNKPVYIELIERKHREDVARGERNTRLLRIENNRLQSVRWYDRLLSRVGTLLVNFGLRLEERCAICSEQLLGEKNQPTSVMGRK